MSRTAMARMVQLFCLPHSGASAMAYARWNPLLPAWLEAVPLELPGRGCRMGEPLQTSLLALAEQLAKELAQAKKPDASYALFGHSLGGLLAFELAHALMRHGLGEPCTLFVSATAAPARRDDRHRAEPLSDQELIGEMRRLGGTPEEVFTIPELLDMALPILRADFLLTGRYAYQRRMPLKCPVRVFGGTGDSIPTDDLRAWQEETQGDFSLDMFEGGHFYLRGCEASLLDRLVGSLAGLQGPRPV